MLVKTFDEDCDIGLYTLQYHLLAHMVEIILKCLMLSVLDNSSHEYFNIYIRPAFRGTLQCRRTRMLEIVNSMKRSYKISLPYGKKETDEKLGREDERSAKS